MLITSIMSVPILYCNSSDFIIHYAGNNSVETISITEYVSLIQLILPIELTLTDYIGASYVNENVINDINFPGTNLD